MSRATVAALLLVTAGVAVAQNYRIDGSCREGQPHGAYELRTASGQVRVVGAFNRGKRTGSFLFWSSDGSRIAQLPFDEDVLSGTLALWYLPSPKQLAATPKLEAVFANGQLSGVKRSWYANGRIRAEYRYDRGALVEARVFSESGKALTDADARATAARDVETDRKYHESLDAIVRDNLPRCEPS